MLSIGGSSGNSGSSSGGSIAGDTPTRHHDLPAPIPLHQLDEILAHRSLQPKRPGADKQRKVTMDSRQHDMRALAREDRAHDGLGDGLGRERIRDEAVAGIEAVEERGAREALGDEHGADAVGAVERGQLGGEAFVEGDGAGLGRAVVDHARGGDVCGDRGDRHDHAVVAAYHGRDEGLGERVVGERVDGCP